jgi:hypothetical protein
MTGKKRRTLLVLVLLGSVAAGIAFVAWPRSAINAATAARIEKGMTLAEAEAILGGPPRDESSGPIILFQDDSSKAQAEGIVDVMYNPPFTSFRKGVVQANRPVWMSNQRIVLVRLDM